jgi:hypothetical protein
VRSAVYGAAEASERREVHRVRAHTTDPTLDPDRRAWHRAHAASVPDDEVAGELQRRVNGLPRMSPRCLG